MDPFESGQVGTSTRQSTRYSAGRHGSAAAANVFTGRVRKWTRRAVPLTDGGQLMAMRWLPLPSTSAAGGDACGPSNLRKRHFIPVSLFLEKKARAVAEVEAAAAAASAAAAAVASANAAAAAAAAAAATAATAADPEAESAAGAVAVAEVVATATEDVELTKEGEEGELEVASAGEVAGEGKPELGAGKGAENGAFVGNEKSSDAKEGKRGEGDDANPVGGTPRDATKPATVAVVALTEAAVAPPPGAAAAAKAVEQMSEEEAAQRDVEMQSIKAGSPANGKVDMAEADEDLAVQLEEALEVEEEQPGARVVAICKRQEDEGKGLNMGAEAGSGDLKLSGQEEEGRRVAERERGGSEEVQGVDAEAGLCKEQGGRVAKGTTEGEEDDWGEREGDEQVGKEGGVDGHREGGGCNPENKFG